MSERVVSIRGLVKGTTINDITEHFSVAGEVEKVKFEYDESAELPTEAYILFKHKTSAETAIADPNFSEFKGSKLQIRPITISQEKCLTEWLTQLETKPPNSDLKDALAYINRLSLADKNAVLIALGGNPDKTVEKDVATGVNQPATLQASVISPHNLLHIPTIPLFNGEETKAQVNYDQWSFEVRCLQNSKLYTESTLLQGIRRSLRGTAADAFKHMGENVTVNAVLKRFEVRFGNVLSNDQLWEEFYTAHQKPGESITAWGTRIENLLDQLTLKGELDSSIVPSTLRNKFFYGLANKELRTNTRHKFDKKLTYEELFQYTRSIECEYQDAKDASNTPKSKKQVVQSHQSTFEGIIEKKLDKIVDNIGSLEKRIVSLENTQRQHYYQNSRSNQNVRRGQGHQFNNWGK